jgi:antitoxin (DNA-binding transcriptional repressor) of toxin-antitoxin stability system
MKSVKASELKASLAKYLRLVRGGERLEILDRGVPIAIIQGVCDEEIRFSSPAKDPRNLAKLKSKAKPTADYDIVDDLLEERRRR